MIREQVLYTILKIDTDFICSNDLNIKDYNLKKAAADGCLVSVGDNILFDRIRSYYGDNRTYKEIFGNVCFLRQSLRRAKKDGRTRDARLFNHAILKQVFVEDVVNVGSCSKSQFRKVAKDGFYLNGKKYVPFAAGAGQLRRETVTFINEKLYQPMFDILSCDIMNRVDTINIAKFSAYFALTLSSIMWVDTPRCCIIEDFETTIPKQKVDWICKNEKGEGYIEEREVDVVLNSADGQGLISPKQARLWAENMGLDYCPGQFVARSAYIKGNFVVFDFQEYARVHGITTITDCYGIKHNIEDIDCLVSQSQFKMWKYYKSFEEYEFYARKGGIKWGVARYNKKEDPVWSLVNYQFIQLLRITPEQITELLTPTIEWIKKICTGDKLYSLLYCFGGFDSDTSYQDIYSRAENLAMKAVIRNPEFLKDSYVQKKIYYNIIEAINRAKIGKIWARGNYQFMISDPIAQCQSALKLPVKGSIPADNVYSNFWNELNVTGNIMLGRNPCIDEHEINVCKLYRDDETDYWFRHLQSGIIYSIYDTSVCRHSDSDLTNRVR